MKKLYTSLLIAVLVCSFFIVLVKPAKADLSETVRYSNWDNTVISSAILGASDNLLSTFVKPFGGFDTGFYLTRVSIKESGIYASGTLTVSVYNIDSSGRPIGMVLTAGFGHVDNGGTADYVSCEVYFTGNFHIIASGYYAFVLNFTGAGYINWGLISGYGFTYSNDAGSTFLTDLSGTYMGALKVYGTDELVIPFDGTAITIESAENHGGYYVAFEHNVPLIMNTKFVEVWNSIVYAFAAQGHGSLILGAGNFYANWSSYNVANVLDVRSNLWISGQGSQTIIRAIDNLHDNNNASLALIGTNGGSKANNVSISNLAMYGDITHNSGKTHPYILGQVWGDNWNVYNCFFEDGGGFDLAFSSHCTFTNNVFYNCSCSVYVDEGSDHATVSNNYMNMMMYCHDGAIAVVTSNWLSESTYGTVINNNTIVGVYGGAQPSGINVYESAYLTISNNIIKYCDNAGIYTSGGAPHSNTCLNISSNQIDHCKLGLDIENDYLSTISNNNISYCDWEGILDRSDSSIFSSNRLSYNGVGEDFWQKAQFMFWSAQNVTVLYNDVEFTSGWENAALYLYEGDYYYIEYNTLIYTTATGTAPLFNMYNVEHYYIYGNIGVSDQSSDNISPSPTPAPTATPSPTPTLPPTSTYTPTPTENPNQTALTYLQYIFYGIIGVGFVTFLGVVVYAKNRRDRGK